MLLLVMNSGVSSIERTEETKDQEVVSLTIGTSMKILSHHSTLACRQLRHKVLSDVEICCESLSHHLKVV